MLKSIPIILLAFIILSFSCTRQEQDGKVEHVKEKRVEKEQTDEMSPLTISPAGFYEECFELLQNQIVEYSFEATIPLTFALRYYVNAETEYPLFESDISTQDGTFEPVEGQTSYCFEWSNTRQEEAVLHFDYTVRAK